MSTPSYLIILCACGFAAWQNAYFGHNTFPKSDAELICDGIAMLMVVIGLASISITNAIDRRP